MKAMLIVVSLALILVSGVLLADEDTFTIYTTVTREGEVLAVGSTPPYLCERLDYDMKGMRYDIEAMRFQLLLLRDAVAKLVAPMGQWREFLPLTGPVPIASFQDTRDLDGDGDVDLRDVGILFNGLTFERMRR